LRFISPVIYPHSADGRQRVIADALGERRLGMMTP
jgi:hypothetical protein